MSSTETQAQTSTSHRGGFSWPRGVAVAVLGGLIVVGFQAIADIHSEPGGVPRLIPYRGHLEDAEGPITDEVELAITLYDEAAGGDVLWGPETHSVTPIDGDFSVMLGESVTLDPQLLAGGDVYVGVSVDGTALSGRQRLGSVPFALRALNGVPTGTVVAFAGRGDEVPNGWLLCDGREVSREEYSDLFGVIGTYHGAGNETTTFHLPDYRGRFLRGVTGSVARDPDVATREAANVGGSVGNGVGSVQGYSFSQHQHYQTTYAGCDEGEEPGAMIEGWSGGTGPHNTRNLTSIATTGGGSETRPLNAYVNYIIKL